MATSKKAGEKKDEAKAPSAKAKAPAASGAAKAAAAKKDVKTEAATKAKAAPAAKAKPAAEAKAAATPASKKLVSPVTVKAAKAVATEAVKNVKKKVSEVVEAVTEKARPAARKKATAAESAAAPEWAAAKKPAAKAETEPAKRTTRKTMSAPAAAAKSASSKKGNGDEKPAKPSTRKPGKTAVGALAPEVADDGEVDALLKDFSGSESFRPESDISEQNPTDVREKFFHEHRPGPPPAPEARELPNEYGDTRIVLLVRDPEWVYAYWEINDETRDRIGIPRNGNTPRMAIRLFKVSGRSWPKEAAHYTFDVDVSPYASSWYIKLPEVNEEWCAELGIFDQKNDFVSVCRSNVFGTPRSSISTDTDSEWMVVEETFRKLVNVAGGVGNQVRGVGQASKGASETLLRQLQRTVTGQLKLEAGNLSSGSLFSGSFAEGGVATQKDFWLQVHTELILYGATEPDARVTVAGQPVKLNADGTFSLRFNLPDGEQVLRVHAVNADGDMERAITPVVTRHIREED